MTAIRPEIFREYDIRGIAGRDLTLETVELIGRGIGTLMRLEGKSRIAVGRDCRLSSDGFHDALAIGLTHSGISLIDIGVVPTPLLYYSIFYLKSDGGVMITGSHNPPEHNGFKICVGTETIHGPRIRQIREIIEAGDFAEGYGEVSEAEVVTPYKRHVMDQICLARKIRVAVDCGNGTAALVAPDLIAALGCDVTELYCQMDGRFPHHHPDPTVEANLRDLQSTVQTRGLDLGVAFDGDADRLGVVDNTGRIIWGDMLLVLFATDILKFHPGATFISEVKGSMNLYREIEKRGGRPIMWKTGHSLIKAKMREEGALLAGEMSGHMFFADRYFGYDDALYAACRLLEIVAGSAQSLSEMLSDIPPTVVTPEIRVQCDDDKKFAVVDRIKQHFQRTRTVIDIDGARVLFPNGWGLVRASNTQDLLVLRFEASDEENLLAIRSEIEGKVRQTIDQMTSRE